MGKQHCQELDNPGGKSSKYWASKGWKYEPSAEAGQCDRNRFNYVNREMQNLDGFDGVTFWYLESRSRLGGKRALGAPIYIHAECTYYTQISNSFIFFGTERPNTINKYSI